MVGSNIEGCTKTEKIVNGVLAVLYLNFLKTLQKVFLDDIRTIKWFDGGPTYFGILLDALNKKDPKIFLVDVCLLF